MSRFTSLLSAMLLLSGTWNSISQSTFQGAPTPGSPSKPSPLSPEEQRQSFTLPEGFEIELVAAEPEIVKPIMVAFDDAGRMWTVTAREYPVDGNENPEAARQLYANGGRDQVLVFENIHGPGPHKPRVFIDGLAMPMGVLPIRGGVIVSHGSEVLFYQDTDNDGKADKKEVLLSGFGVQDSHLMPHQLTRGPGDWIYVAQGAFNSSRVKSKEGNIVQFDQCKLGRFRPDGSKFEIAGVGLNNIWGLVIDRKGEFFIQEANDLGFPVAPFFLYATYPGIGENKYKPYSPWMTPLAGFHMGGTGLSGLALSDDQNAFPGAYKDVMFVANPITSKINAVKIHPDGTGIRLEKLPEFVQSSDPWFRPVAITIGPEGALYITDWYNKIISHNEVPRTHPERDRVRGRIWRVKHKSMVTKPFPDLTKVKEKELIQRLESASTWEGRAAKNQIIDRKATSLGRDLTALMLNSSKPVDARLLALWSLEAMAAADPDSIGKLFKDSSRSVRREAVRVYGGLATDKNISAIATLANDPDPQVRAEVIRAAGSLSQFGSKAAGILVASIKGPLDGPTKKTEQGGYTVNIGAAADRDFERFLARLSIEKHPAEVLAYLESPEGKKVDGEARLLVMQSLDPQSGARALVTVLPTLQRELSDVELLSLLQGVKDPEVAKAVSQLITKAAILERLFKLKIEPFPVELAPILAGAVRTTGTPQALLIKTATQFRLKALEPDLLAALKGAAAPEQKQSVLKALRDVRSENLEAFRASAADTKAPESLRKEAVLGLASISSDAAAQSLIELWPGLNLSLRQSAIQRMTASKGSARLVVDALVAGKINAIDFDLSSLERLRTVLGEDPQLQGIFQKLGVEFEYALQLNGKKEDYVDSNITLEGPFTVETWVRLDSGISNEDGILGVPGGADFNFAGALFRVYGGPSLGDLIVASKPITPDNWTHFAVSRNASGEFKLYVNGERDRVQGKPSKNKFENLDVGRVTPSVGTKGFLMEYRVWKVERTPDQIRDWMNLSLAKETKPAELTHYFGGEKWGALSGGAKVKSVADFPTLYTAGEAKTQRELFEKYRVIAEKPGIIESGKQIATTYCLNCHNVLGHGGNVGPSLSGAGAVGVEGLLRSILSPNAAIESGYRRYRVETTDGELVEGIFVSENDVRVLLRQPNAADLSIAKSTVKKASFLKTSMMPEGLLDALEPQQISDLFAYLRSLGAVNAPVAANEKNKTEFFNGKDLAGWDGNSALWRVENGVIIGKSQGLGRNEFLRSHLLLKDFRLVMKVKMVMQNKGFENSGVQFRSQALPEGEMKGYQADIGPEWWGKLYEEHGRGLLWDKSGEAHVKLNDWNTYEILAVGSKIKTAINGKLCVDLDDAAGMKEGIIGFQLHSGGPMEIHFKEFNLDLNPPAELVTAR